MSKLEILAMEKVLGELSGKESVRERVRELVKGVGELGEKASKMKTSGLAKSHGPFLLKVVSQVSKYLEECTGKVISAKLVNHIIDRAESAFLCISALLNLQSSLKSQPFALEKRFYKLIVLVYKLKMYEISLEQSCILFPILLESSCRSLDSLKCTLCVVKYDSLIILKKSPESHPFRTEVFHEAFSKPPDDPSLAFNLFNVSYKILTFPQLLSENDQCELLLCAFKFYLDHCKGCKNVSLYLNKSLKSMEDQSKIYSLYSALWHHLLSYSADPQHVEWICSYLRALLCKPKIILKSLQSVIEWGGTGIPDYFISILQICKGVISFIQTKDPMMWEQSLDKMCLSCQSIPPSSLPYLLHSALSLVSLDESSRPLLSKTFYFLSKSLQQFTDSPTLVSLCSDSAIRFSKVVEEDSIEKAFPLLEFARLSGSESLLPHLAPIYISSCKTSDIFIPAAIELMERLGHFSRALHLYSQYSQTLSRKEGAKVALKGIQLAIDHNIDPPNDLLHSIIEWKVSPSSIPEECLPFYIRAAASLEEDVKLNKSLRPKYLIERCAFLYSQNPSGDYHEYVDQAIDILLPDSSDDSQWVLISALIWKTLVSSKPSAKIIQEFPSLPETEPSDIHFLVCNLAYLVDALYLFRSDPIAEVISFLRSLKSYSNIYEQLLSFSTHQLCTWISLVDDDFKVPQYLDPKTKLSQLRLLEGDETLPRIARALVACRIASAHCDDPIEELCLRERSVSMLLSLESSDYAVSSWRMYDLLFEQIFSLILVAEKLGDHRKAGYFFEKVRNWKDKWDGLDILHEIECQYAVFNWRKGEEYSLPSCISFSQELRVLFVQAVIADDPIPVLEEISRLLKVHFSRRFDITQWCLGLDREELKSNYCWNFFQTLVLSQIHKMDSKSANSVLEFIEINDSHWMHISTNSHNDWDSILESFSHLYLSRRCIGIKQFCHRILSNVRTSGNEYEFAFFSSMGINPSIDTEREVEEREDLSARLLFTSLVSFPKTSKQIPEWFHAQLRNLPDSWNVCCIDLIDDDLCISKFNGNFSVSAKLSEPDQLSTNLERFETILQKAICNFKSGVDVTNRAEKHEKWSERILIDREMESLFHKVEESFSSWKGMLLGSLSKSDDEASVSKLATEIISEFCPNSDISHSETVRSLLRCVPFFSSHQLEKALADVCIHLNQAPLTRSQCSKMKSFSKEIIQWSKTILFEYNPVIFILGDRLQSFPLESLVFLQKQCISRVPSLVTLSHLLQRNKSLLDSAADPSNSFFVLNPSKDLIRTEKLFQPIFSSRFGWEGIVGEAPGKEVYSSALTQYELFVYCGHGGGQQYLSFERLKKLSIRSISLLLGCSSGRVMNAGQYDPKGIPSAYMLAGAPVMVGNLWDVTDAELDRFGSKMLDLWVEDEGHSLSLLEAVSSARSACKLRYLIGSSPVCYGLPVHIRHKL